jgi:hypothetical protein
MDYLPSWFGAFEYYLIIVTIWFFLASWILVNLIKVKFNLKSKIVSLKQYLKKRKEKKEQDYV